MTNWLNWVKIDFSYLVRGMGNPHQGTLFQRLTSLCSLTSKRILTHSQIWLRLKQPHPKSPILAKTKKKLWSPTGFFFTHTHWAISHHIFFSHLPPKANPAEAPPRGVPHRRWHPTSARHTSGSVRWSRGRRKKSEEMNHQKRRQK